MARALRAGGILLIIAGLVWAAQGTRLLPYPAESFMIGDATWTWIGGVTAVVGAALLVAARRMRG